MTREDSKEMFDSIEQELIELKMKEKSLRLKQKELLEKKNKNKKEILYDFQKSLKFILYYMDIPHVNLAFRSCITRQTMSRIVNNVTNYTPQTRMVFISLLMIAAESDEWDILYIWFYEPELFDKMVNGYQLSDKEKKKVKQGIEDTWIPFGEYKIPKGLFDMMMS